MTGGGKKRKGDGLVGVWSDIRYSKSMARYNMAKVITVVCIFSTIILFVLAQTGRLAELFSPAIAYTLYIGNFACLVASLIFFIWQKAHRDMPRRREREALETYARLADEGALQSRASDAMTIDAEVFWRLQQYGDTVTISVAKMNPLRVPQVGTRAMVAPLGNPDNTVVVKVVKREGELMTISPVSDAPRARR